MKRFGQYSKWILAFIFVVLVIVVYKTFDNFSKIGVFFGNLISIINPFVVGFIIAYLLNIPCKKIQNTLNKSKFDFLRKYKKQISIISVYILLFGLFFILMRAVIPTIYRNIVDIYVNLPNYTSIAIQHIKNLQLDNKFRILQIDEHTIAVKVQEIINSIDLTKFSKYAQGVVNITSGVFTAFIALIVSMYMLIDKDQIKNTTYKVILSFINRDMFDKIVLYIKKINDIFVKYVYCQLLDAIIVATLSIISLSLLNVKYSMLLGILVGIFNVIPYFGAIIGVGGVVVITLFTGGFMKGVWTAVALLVMQQIDANIINPRIMSNSLEIRPLWVIFAVTVGGELFGVAGMVLSVPVMAMIKLIFSDYLKARQARKGIKLEDNDE